MILSNPVNLRSFSRSILVRQRPSCRSVSITHARELFWKWNTSQFTENALGQRQIWRTTRRTTPRFQRTAGFRRLRPEAPQRWATRHQLSLRMHMRAFDVITAMDPQVLAEQTKIHLATHTQVSTLDLYLAGKFDEWQRWQTLQNFRRKFVLSLVKLPSRNRWLFAGVHNSYGSEYIKEKGLHYYRLEERSACSEFSGRLVVRFERPGRQLYLNAESWLDSIDLLEILPERMKIAEFPGYKRIDLSKAELDTIVNQGLTSWRTALSNVAGVYLISDTISGKLYVGSATGEGGIWQRWVQYSATGHGGNVELMRLLENQGSERVAACRFSVLEVADSDATWEEILSREAHWKGILLTRTHGLNLN
jgi:hypothetical protein